MCRLYGFLANEPTKVECCLVAAQNALLRAPHGRPNQRDADGWGVACYDEQQRWSCPTLVRHKNLVLHEACFSRTAENTYSRAVVAHLRQSTVGIASSE